MTAQIAERLRYQGEDVAMYTNPLDNFFAMGGVKPRFELTSTALWRGYVGTWEIVDDRLYLIELNGRLVGGADASLATFFPDFPDRVFANWYSGTIRIPQGKQLKYVHMGYDSAFERDLYFELERGVVVASCVRHNGIADSESPTESYEIAAKTTLPRDDTFDMGVSDSAVHEISGTPRSYEEYEAQGGAKGTEVVDEDSRKRGILRSVNDEIFDLRKQRMLSGDLSVRNQKRLEDLRAVREQLQCELK